MTKADMHAAKMTHHKKEKKTVEVMVTSAQCAQKAWQGKKKLSETSYFDLHSAI